MQGMNTNPCLVALNMTIVHMWIVQICKNVIHISNIVIVLKMRADVTGTDQINIITIDWRNCEVSIC